MTTPTGYRSGKLTWLVRSAALNLTQASGQLRRHQFIAGSGRSNLIWPSLEAIQADRRIDFMAIDR